MSRKDIFFISVASLVINFNIFQYPQLTNLEEKLYTLLPFLSIGLVDYFILVRFLVILLYVITMIAHCKLSSHLKSFRYQYIGVFLILLLPVFFDILTSLSTTSLFIGLLSCVYLFIPSKFLSKILKKIQNNRFKKLLEIVKNYLWVQILGLVVTILLLIQFTPLSIGLLGSFIGIHLLQIILNLYDEKFEIIKEYRLRTVILVIAIIIALTTNISPLNTRWSKQENQSYFNIFTDFDNIIQNNKLVYNNPIFRSKNSIPLDEIDLEDLFTQQYYILIDTRVQDKNTTKILDIKDNFNTLLRSENEDIFLFSTIKSFPTALVDSWEFYKQVFITEQGQVIDLEENVSTSEGQSYAMLRAVIMNDQQTFNSVWSYTQDKFQSREDDKLFSWLMQADTEEIIDFTVASDADIDIATALLLASEKWGSEVYLTEAKEIIEDIWRKLIFNFNNTYYLAYSDDPFQEESLILNPSYFSPHAYRMFQQVNTNAWDTLVLDTYEVLDQLSQRLGYTSLPPNWIAYNTETGSYQTTQISNINKDDYGFDSFRVFFRIALDYQQFNSQFAREYLAKYANIFNTIYQNNGFLPAITEVNGDKIAEYQTVSTNTALISVWLDVEEKKQLTNTILFKDFNGSNWGKFKNYYDQNWGWFATALAEERFDLNKNFDK